MKLHSLLTVAFALATVVNGHAKAANAKRPNFIVIYSDDHTYRAVGYRNPAVQTPNLDRLAAEGLRLGSMFTASPICAASRASVMTGVFPQQHGCVGLYAAGFRESVVRDKRFVTLPQVLGKAGYRTALFGKSHLGPPTTFGFDEGNETKDSNDDENFPLGVQFLERQAKSGQPFLLWLTPHNPHVGFTSPQRFHDQYKDTEITLDPNWRESPPVESLYNQGAAGEICFRDSGGGEKSGGPPRSAEQMKRITRDYYADVSCLDECIGKFVAEVKRLGLWENTILIYTSDNGYFLGNHGLGNKVTMHEESVRVPSFVVSPLLKTARQAKSDALVSALDIFPTLLDYAGVPAPPQLMGKTLRSIFENPGATVREHIVCEGIGVPERRLGVGHRMVRDARFKYILTSSNEEAFFDLQEDPFEMKSRIDDPSLAGEIARHQQLLAEWMKRVGEQRLEIPTTKVVPVGTANPGKARKAEEKKRKRKAQSGAATPPAPDAAATPRQ